MNNRKDNTEDEIILLSEIENILKVTFENPLYPLKLPHYFDGSGKADWGYVLGWKECVKQIKSELKKI